MYIRRTRAFRYPLFENFAVFLFLLQNEQFFVQGSYFTYPNFELGTGGPVRYPFPSITGDFLLLTQTNQQETRACSDSL